MPDTPMSAAPSGSGAAVCGEREGGTPRRARWLARRRCAAVEQQQAEHRGAAGDTYRGETGGIDERAAQCGTAKEGVGGECHQRQRRQGDDRGGASRCAEPVLGWQHVAALTRRGRWLAVKSAGMTTICHLKS